MKYMCMTVWPTRRPTWETPQRPISASAACCWDTTTLSLCRPAACSTVSCVENLHCCSITSSQQVQKHIHTSAHRFGQKKLGLAFLFLLYMLLFLCPGASDASRGEGHSGDMAAVVVPVLFLLLLGVCGGLVVLYLRHRRLQNNFTAFANSHYNSRLGSAIFSSGDELGETTQIFLQLSLAAAAWLFRENQSSVPGCVTLTQLGAAGSAIHTIMRESSVGDNVTTVEPPSGWSGYKVSKVGILREDNILKQLAAPCESEEAHREPTGWSQINRKTRKKGIRKMETPWNSFHLCVGWIHVSKNCCCVKVEEDEWWMNNDCENNSGQSHRDITLRFLLAKSSKLKTICAHTLVTLFTLVMEIFVG